MRRVVAGIGKYRKEYAEPFLAVTGSGAHHVFVEPLLLEIGQASAGNRTQSVNESLSTVMTKAEHCVVSSGGIDIRFKMLSPDELKLAQGFPADYKVTGNRTEQVRQIGNAVPVNTANALIMTVIKQAAG